MMNLSAKKIIILFLVLIVVFNSSKGFLKPNFVESQYTGDPTSAEFGGSEIGTSGEIQPGSGVAGGACAAISTIVGGGTSWVSGITSNPICQAIQIVQQVYSAIADAVWKSSEIAGRSLRDIIAKRFIDQIVNETVKWIQGGGKPKFIGNWEGFMKDAGDIAFDSVIKEVGLADLCSPFGLQVKLALLPVKKFGTQINCTLDKVVKNINDFYVDFSVGGWDGYLASWEPNNNFYGQILLAQDEIAKRAAEKKEAAKNEGAAGGGFIGDKICKAGADKSDEVAGEVALSESGNACEQARKDCVIENIKNNSTFSINCDQEFSGCINDMADLVAKDKNYSMDKDGQYCDSKDLVDTTPGSIVGKAVGEAITSDKDWAANIQSWTSALVNAAINRVIKEGVLKMQEATAEIQDSYYPSEYKSLMESNTQKSKNDMIKLITPLTKEWNALLSAKSNSLVLAQEVLLALQEIKNKNCSSVITDPPTQAIIWQSGFVSDSDIQNAQNAVNTLQSEIDDLKKKIAIAEALINKINAADTVEKQTAVNFEVNQFMSAYNTQELQMGIVTGNAQKDANQQTADLKKQLEDEYGTLPGGTYGVIKYGLRTRLATCRATAIIINNGATSTTNQNVILNINTLRIGITNANQMLISNDSAFTGAVWEAVTAVKSWTLIPGAGLKTVYIRFNNILGEISNIFSDDINLQ